MDYGTKWLSLTLQQPQGILIRNMRISRYGTGSVVKTTTVCGLLLSGGVLLHSPGGAVLAAAAAIYLAFTLYFYRDPERSSPDEPGAVIAPADGKVLLVRPIGHPLTGEDATLVSIFMSPFNVHVNRIPVQGKVTHLRYRPGKFLMAFDHQSMADNERMEIGIDSPIGSLWFCQVSGFLARRIVCRLEPGQEVAAGERFGMIKFGSRADIVLPSGVMPCVAEGETTVAGRSVIGRASSLF